MKLHNRHIDFYTSLTRVQIAEIKTHSSSSVFCYRLAVPFCASSSRCMDNRLDTPSVPIVTP